jgi:hypothetical protein
MSAGADQIFVPPPVADAPLGGARVTGQVTAITGSTLQLALRGNRTISVDLTSVRENHKVGPIMVGEFLQVQGRLSGATLNAMAAVRSKSEPSVWAPDIP